MRKPVPPTETRSRRASTIDGDEHRYEDEYFERRLRFRTSVRVRRKASRPRRAGRRWRPCSTAHDGSRATAPVEVLVWKDVAGRRPARLCTRAQNATVEEALVDDQPDGARTTIARSPMTIDAVDARASSRPGHRGGTSSPPPRWRGGAVGAGCGMGGHDRVSRIPWLREAMEPVRRRSEGQLSAAAFQSFRNSNTLHRSMYSSSVR